MSNDLPFARPTPHTHLSHTQNHSIYRSLEGHHRFYYQGGFYYMGTASSAILQRFVLNRYMVLAQAPYTLSETQTLNSELKCCAAGGVCTQRCT
jgi:hypothetical protein